MINTMRDGWHETYTETPRHWCPRSESYTGGDSLLTALNQGWLVINHAVYREVIMFNKSRFTTVYYFRLIKQGRTRTMAVMSNPFVNRLVQKHQYRIRSINEYAAESEPAMPVEYIALEAAGV